MTRRIQRRNQVEHTLLSASRRRTPEGRPLCPVCGQRHPGPSINTPEDPHANAEWLQQWGHRCQHDEPCPGWSGLAVSCRQCWAEMSAEKRA